MVKRNKKNLLDSLESRYVLDRESHKKMTGPALLDEMVSSLEACLANGKLYNYRYGDDVGKGARARLVKMLYLDCNHRYTALNIHKGNYLNVSTYFLKFFSESFISPILYGDSLVLVFGSPQLVKLYSLKRSIVKSLAYASSYSFNTNESSYLVHVYYDTKSCDLMIARERSDEMCK